MALALSNHSCSSPLSRLRLTPTLSAQHPSALKLRCPATSPTLRNLNLTNLDSRAFQGRCFRRRGVACLAMAESNTTPSVFQDLQEEAITLGFIKDMIADFKTRKLLDKKYVYKILKQTRDLLLSLPSIVDIRVPDGKHVTVCDDLHGQFEDLMHMFKLNGLPSENNPYIFNGNFVNRGDLSVEVLLTLFAFKCMCPSAIYLTRANHEDDEHMNKVYGFEREVKSKLGEEFLQHFVQVFHCLPLAYVINHKIAIHGGEYGVKPFCEPEVKGLVITSGEARRGSYGVGLDGKTKIVSIFSPSNYCKIRFQRGRSLVMKIMAFAGKVLGWTIICILAYSIISLLLLLIICILVVNLK